MALAPSEIRFDSMPMDRSLIRLIVHRATKPSSSLRAALEAMGSFTRTELEMDLTAVHLNICKLRLDELLNADEFNFAHDILGIRRHLNRQTCELERCFIPRFTDRMWVYS